MLSRFGAVCADSELTTARTHSRTTELEAFEVVRGTCVREVADGNEN